MCGICGVYDPSGRGVDSTLVEAIRDRLRHRGPDDAGLYHDPLVGLGMTRLSIIDLETGHQPIANEDGTIWVVCNGEIYNFQALRAMLEQDGHRFTTRSDSEVIVHLYERDGEACVDHLEGMFAFAVWDRPRRRLLLARDHLGIKPLYYAPVGQGLVFASELKALLCHPDLSRDVDLCALDDYLTLEYVPAPKTIYRAIRKLPPAHRLIADARGVRVERYWQARFIPKTAVADERALAEQLLELLGRAVRSHLVSDVPIGLLLSGGLDSSAVAALMPPAAAASVRSFTVRFEESSFDESSHARAVAKHLGIRHHEELLTAAGAVRCLPKVMAALDEPLGDASAIPTFFLSRMARRQVTVALSGEGGDELFAGYPTYQAHRLAAWYRRLPLGIRECVVSPLIRALPVSRDNLSFDFRAKRFLAGMTLAPTQQHLLWMGSLGPDAKRQVLTDEVQSALRTQPYESLEAVAGSLNGGERLDLVDTMLRMDLETYLPNDLLVKVDLMSMANSLEVRVPFLDRHVVEFACTLPSRWKLRGLTTKYLVRRALATRLPRKVVRRPKKGFGIPVAEWIRGPLRPLIVDALDAARLSREGFFNGLAVRRLLDEHMAGAADHRKPLWSLFVFQQWMSSQQPS